ncbi:histidine phosphatase family protein [Streptomyces sp. XD-27]|uniref:SixA phosphatase family protein n=1 Tax=Streptomyces sp. XD-27 TaxID=3062779 RepID=UPI0026F4280B|nr:histidine phosphatase family protein [Streptomyces sp. XD-27]WKX69941.1 histidine phosphatase family protein [Streptomyces sp. XD-27]
MTRPHGRADEADQAGVRRLVLLRHAKSAWPDGVADRDRPLAPRGRRDAPAAGRWLRDAGRVPDLAICSTARRARETWELAAAALSTAAPPVSYEPRLYATTAPALIDVVRETPAALGTLLLIGHNPGMQELTLRLARDAVGDALERAAAKFPTAAVAVLTWHGTWSELAPGAARLVRFAVPRGPKP